MIGTITATQTNAGIQGSSTGPLILTGPFIAANNGRLAVYASFWRWASTIVSSTYFQVPTSNLLSTRNLVTADNITGMPAASDVKSGIAYGPSSELTGTFSQTVTPSTADIATAVWGAASRTITGGTVDTLTNAPTVPSVVQIRQEMDSNSTKLANLDATISSRLSPSGTLAVVTTLTNAPTVPSAASIRAEIDSNSTQLAAIKAKTDNIPASPAAVSDIPTTAQIATAVEGSLLNEADGQAVLNAIVGAIGNTNLSEVSLVAAVRADLERNGGKLINLDAAISSRLAAADYSAPTSAPTAASVATAVWGAATKEITGGTVTTLTNSPDVPTEAEIASQVRTELSVELGRIDAAVSSRLAPSGTLATVTTLTNAPTVPTAAAIADEVRVELATELARIDAPVSGATAPSAATVATAVRSELSVELARVDQAVSTRLAGSAYTAPANSDVAAIKAKTDALNTERLANVATTAIVGNLIAQANS